MKAAVVIGKNYTYDPVDFQDRFVVGVDVGSMLCIKNKIPMDIAVGDFDSITKDEYKELLHYCKVKKLNPVKDETDTLEAIDLCKNYDEILILGGITGNRIEHFFANYLLLAEDERIKIKDDNSFIFSCSKNIEIRQEVYKFVSIFSLDDDTKITLKGFKYPLNDYCLKCRNTIGISNEIIDKTANIEISSGRILVILSKDDK